MYAILAATFGIIFISSVYGMFRYGFNAVFIYIGLFSLTLVVWALAAIKHEKGNKGDEFR